MRCTAASWSRSSVSSSGAICSSNEAADSHSVMAVSPMPMSARARALERTAVLRRHQSMSGFGYESFLDFAILSLFPGMTGKANAVAFRRKSTDDDVGIPAKGLARALTCLLAMTPRQLRQPLRTADFQDAACRGASDNRRDRHSPSRPAARAGRSCGSAPWPRRLPPLFDERLGLNRRPESLRLLGSLSDHVNSKRKSVAPRSQGESRSAHSASNRAGDSEY